METGGPRSRSFGAGSCPGPSRACARPSSPRAPVAFAVGEQPFRLVLFGKDAAGLGQGPPEPGHLVFTTSPQTCL